ncbi:MAG TPA: efflux RND transporter periplasmic adaptor subunit, partial [Leptospiraceae bacterium]|nr:efflux RND transporter periplasmic adaptor subunit [Leptospiraceae bacterium]
MFLKNIMENVNTPVCRIFSRSGDAAVGRIYITSPLTGIALARDAVPGAQVDASAVLGTVGDISEVWFMIKIFEKDLSKIREGTGARIILNAYPGETFEGRVDFIGNQIDPGSRTVNGRIVLKNRESRAKIGLFGKALIDIQDDSVLQIRSSALFESDRKKFVFVERSKGEYEAREVRTGRVSEDSLEILSGVIEGEKIIIKGVFSLKSVHLKSTFGEE